MFRIERDEREPGRIVFRLDGRLGQREVEVLLGSIGPELGAGCAVEIDLAELRFLDDPAARRLGALKQRGVHLTGATGYVHELLSSLENER